jgi:hypothetical protein
MPLLSLNGIKMIERLGGQFIFKIITQQTKHMSALNHWGMQRKAGVICVVFVLHVLWL